MTQDPTTGQTSVSTDAHTALGESADAWTKYLRVNKGKPDAGTAAQVVNAFIFLERRVGRRKDPGDRRRRPTESELVRQPGNLRILGG